MLDHGPNLRLLHCVYMTCNEISLKLMNLLVYMVARAGIEPATQGFSVLCSTD